MNKPKLQFSKWMLWEKRNDYSYKRYPGIYLISITSKNLAGRYPSLKDVSYIGMTNSNGGLTGRWKQLDNSINGKSGHSGGITMKNSLGLYKNWKKKFKLFVVACPVKCETKKSKRSAKDLILMGHVAYLEYEALARYKRLTGKEPKFNKK